MTLILILNAVLAVAIVGVMVVLHARAIVLDTRQQGDVDPVLGRVPRLSQSRPQPSHTAPRSARPSVQRRQPALVTD